jgi:hypothetical protein
MGSPSADQDSENAEGVLGWLVDAHFDSMRHTCINVTRAALIVAALVLLKLKLALAADDDDNGNSWRFALVFLPLYVLFGFNALHPLFGSSAAPTDGSSRTEFTGPHGDVLAFTRAHVTRWILWGNASLLLLFVLLAVMLDDGGTGSGSGSGVTLAHALIGVWLWAGGAALALVGMLLRFACGVVVLRRGSGAFHHQQLPHHNGHHVRSSDLALAARTVAAAARCCPCHFPWRVALQPEQRNPRLALTLLCVLLVLLGVVAFSVLLVLQQEHHSSLARWLVFLPLSLALLLATVLATASAHRMYAQRCGSGEDTTEASSSTKHPLPLPHPPSRTVSSSPPSHIPASHAPPPAVSSSEVELAVR